MIMDVIQLKGVVRGLLSQDETSFKRAKSSYRILPTQQFALVGLGDMKKTNTKHDIQNFPVMIYYITIYA